MLDRTWKRVGHGRERWEKGNKKRRRNGKSINLLVELVTEFLTKSCMVAYLRSVKAAPNVLCVTRKYAKVLQ